jgi:3-hydroxymyristoyl/3-hydroxydecanoyl-(acyl carrier protein) dehydratase
MRFLFVDRIMQLVPGDATRGMKHITPDDFYLCQDDHGHPCFIPSLIGETIGQLAAWNVMFSNDFTLRPVAGLAAKATLVRPAYVGETLLLESFIDHLDEMAVQYHGIARVGQDIVFTLEGALGPLLPMSDFIDSHEVRQQFAEINKPGEWPPNVASSEKLSISGFSFNVAAMKFDRILSSEPGVSMSAEKRITRVAPYFPDHFPKKPVLPLTVLLECTLQLAKEFVKHAPFEEHYQVRELRKIKMKEFIQPGDVVTCHLTVKHQNDNELILTCFSEIDGKRICGVEIFMEAQS